MVRPSVAVVTSDWMSATLSSAGWNECKMPSSPRASQAENSTMMSPRASFMVRNSASTELLPPPHSPYKPMRVDQPCGAESITRSMARAKPQRPSLSPARPRWARRVQAVPPGRRSPARPLIGRRVDVAAWRSRHVSECVGVGFSTAGGSQGTWAAARRRSRAASFSCRALRRSRKSLCSAGRPAINRSRFAS